MQSTTTYSSQNTGSQTTHAAINVIALGGSTISGRDDHPTVKEIGRSRSEVLRYLLKLKRAIDANHADLIDALTGRLVEVVTDYISYGHFRLMNTFDPAQHLSAAMDQNTKAILDFTDSYQYGMRESRRQLGADLESLAWQIEARFDIEDEIVYH
ncbi:MAG: Rsd/AlgQ family anti-sigma factor [Pseudomonadota bacterium]